MSYFFDESEGRDFDSRHLEAERADEQQDDDDEPETRPCYVCDNETMPERLVVKLLVVDRVDPTQGYKLECGHVVIDV